MHVEPLLRDKDVEKQADPPSLKRRKLINDQTWRMLEEQEIRMDQQERGVSEQEYQHIYAAIRKAEKELLMTQTEIPEETQEEEFPEEETQEQVNEQEIDTEPPTTDDEKCFQAFCDTLRSAPEAEPAAVSSSASSTAANPASSSAGMPPPKAPARRSRRLCAAFPCRNKLKEGCMWCPIHCPNTEYAAVPCKVHWDFPGRCTETSKWCLNSHPRQYPFCVEFKCGDHCKNSACARHGDDRPDRLKSMNKKGGARTERPQFF